MTEAEKDKFIDDYLAHEGIQLDPANIAYNEGLRQTMKIILNSLWGKFGQRGNMSMSKICLEPKEFYAMIGDEHMEITDMFLCPSNPECIEFRYHEKENTAEQPYNTNVYIACFTTCWARLKLYDLLTKLGRHVLYYDTDSVVYHERKDEDLNVKLGELFFILFGVC